MPPAQYVCLLGERSMNDWKIGDKIVCINSTGRKYLNIGDVYTITHIRRDEDALFLCVDGKPTTYISDRFKLASSRDEYIPFPSKRRKHRA